MSASVKSEISVYAAADCAKQIANSLACTAAEVIFNHKRPLETHVEIGCNTSCKLMHKQRFTCHLITEGAC